MVARQILALILDNPNLLYDLPFRPSDLPPPAGEICQRMLERMNKGLPVDTEWVLIHFTQYRDYLLGALEDAPAPSFFQALVNTYKADVLRRRLKALANHVISNLEVTSPEILLSELEEHLKNIKTGEGRTEIAHVAELLPAISQRLDDQMAGRHPWIPSGIHFLYRLLGGLWPGCLYVVAGRPGMGKTAFALSLTNRLVAAGHGTLFLSLEMSNVELLMRLISMKSNVNHHLMRIGQLSQNDLSKITDTCAYLSGIPLYVTDRSTLGLNELRREITRMKRTKDIKVVIVDYLQRITFPTDFVGNTDGAIGAICKGLKTIALENGISLMLLAQLNRQVEGLRERKPELHHLRESGNIEQEADVVAFLYRQAYYNSGEKIVDPHPVEVLVRKNRHGPIGTVRMIFDPSTMEFHEK